MEMLRDKIRGLESRIVEMIRYGQDNVVIADRLQRWTRSLLLTRDPHELPGVLVREAMHHFMIPMAGLRLWGASSVYAEADFARPVGDELKLFANSLTLPYCGVNSGFEAVQWLDEPATARSLALIPLRAVAATEGMPAPTFGMLILASPDPTRYTADMGTEFLLRIGEAAGAGLVRLLPAA